MISKISNITHNLAGPPAETLISKAVRHEHSNELFISYPSPLDPPCPSCGRSFTVRPYFIHPTLNISSHLFFSIFSSLSGTVASVHDVAVNTFSTNDIVLSVMRELVLDWEVRLPQTICIDELKGSSGS